MYCLVQTLDKVDCLKVFVTAKAVGYPFAVLFAVVKVKHRRNRTDSHTVNVVFVEPEHYSRNQKADYLIALEIKEASAPTVTLTFFRIVVLIKAGAVKFIKSVIVLRKKFDGTISIITPIPSI